jgi:hypothetical protein
MEIEDQPEAVNIMTLFEKMLQEQRAMSEVATAVDRLVQRNGKFNGKDVSRFLQDYKAEMLRCKLRKNYRYYLLTELLQMDFKDAFMSSKCNIIHGRGLTQQRRFLYKGMLTSKCRQVYLH